MDSLSPSKLQAGDLFRTAAVGLRTRTMRAALSALGITIGIASLVAVLGLSESSKSNLLTQLDKLGTNLLVVQAGQGIGLGDARLPETASAMVERIGPIDDVSAVGNVDAHVFRSDLMPETRTAGLSVKAAETDLTATLQGSMAEGVFLNTATGAFPTTVLGSVAAERLGVTDLDEPRLVWLGDEWFRVVGILDSIELSPALDRAAIVGVEAAEEYLDFDGVPATRYVRTDPDWVDDVMGVMAATVNPENPDQVEVSRPSDAIEAKAAAESAFTSLFRGLGAVALLVGGVGIASVMAISVPERRAEIGLRRALGATRRHVAVQFLIEVLIRAAIGGVLLGAGVTAAYARIRDWTTLIPRVALWGGLAAALLIGALAGLYPALRAARLSPTEALRTT